MKSKKVLALMMGAIVASSVTSQTAVQVYAHDEESSSSSYSYDDSIGIIILDEEESSENAEPMEDGLGERELIRLENFTSERVNGLLNDGFLQVDNLDNLYVFENNLVFEPTSDTEVRFVCLDEERGFNGDIIVPERVSINGKPYSVTSIGNRAFYECRNLENVTLPASITRIGRHAFAFCLNLQFVGLPENLEIIDDWAFFQCFNLRLEVLPVNLREIGRFAFMECRNLQLRSLPNGLREINGCAFAFCMDLQLEELPGNITRIGESAFSNCRNLQLRSLPNDLREIENSAFAFCANLQLTELPEGLEIIGREAFRDCSSLQLEALPGNLREINDGTFGNCRNLRLAALPADLEIINGYAFMNCVNLRLETLPEGITRIGGQAFSGCLHLRLEELPEGLEIIGARAFADTGIRTITIPASVTELGDSAFDTNSIEEINLAQGSRLNNNDIIRAYGRQLGRVLGFEVVQEHLRIVGQEIITPVELNAEDPEDICSICEGEFNEENGEFGRLPCGHYMHLDCFENLVRNNFERGVSVKCPLCMREYNIF